MSNFNYHPPKEAIVKTMAENGGVYPGSKEYFEARRKQFIAEGRVECPKHRGVFFDPKKYDQCYLCHLEKTNNTRPDKTGGEE